MTYLRYRIDLTAGSAIATRGLHGLATGEVGKALADRRDKIVLATKFFGPMGSDPNMKGGSRRWIVQEVENSLRQDMGQ